MHPTRILVEIKVSGRYKLVRGEIVGYASNNNVTHAIVLITEYSKTLSDGYSTSNFENLGPILKSFALEDLTIIKTQTLSPL